MKFDVALLSRQQPQQPHSIKAFGEASPEVKELYIESTKTAGLFVVDGDGCLRIAAAPGLKKAEDGSIIDVRVNLSNDEFLPAKLPASVSSSSWEWLLVRRSPPRLHTTRSSPLPSSTGR